MTRRAGSELAALLLAQRLVEAAAPPLKAGEFWSLAEAVGDLGRLLGQDATQIAAIAGIDLGAAERLVARLDVATGFAFALDEAEQTGLRLLAGTGEDYPTALSSRLKSAAPPILYLLGDPGLLGAPALGIVGSRAVSESGAALARAAAAAGAAHRLGVVSGGAKGVDRLAMTASLDSGGTVVGVLADSLLRTARDPDIRRAISDGALCLCSPYKPAAGFTVANAMGRNKLIYALSAATLVVECEEGKGGTWAGAVEALRQGTGPVLVWSGDGAGDGNRALVAKGAHPVDDIEHIFPVLTGAPGAQDGAPEPSQRQLALGL